MADGTSIPTTTDRAPLLNSFARGDAGSKRDGSKRHLEEAAAEDHDGDSTYSKASKLFRERANGARDALVGLGRTILYNPADEVQLDVRELQNTLKTQLERAGAAIKLEKMSHVSILFTMIAINMAILLSLSIAIVVAALVVNVNVPIEQSNAVYALEGIARTLALFFVFILVLIYPIRVCAYGVAQQRILPEQLVLSLFLLLINCTPAFSIYGIVAYWELYVGSDMLARSAEGDGISQGTIQGLLIFAFGSYSVGPSALVMEIVILVAALLFVGTMTHAFGATAVASIQQQQQEPSHTPVPLPPLLPPPPPPPDSLVVVPSSLPPRKTLVTLMQEAFAELAQIRSNETILLLILLIVYATVSISLGFVFDFLPSQVPFVGIITVFNVCSKNVNCGQFCDNSGLRNNGTGYTSNCDPNLLGGYAFARALVIMAQFILEFALFVAVHRITLSTRAKLRTVPYDKARTQHLGVKFFTSNKHTIFFWVMVSCIILVSCTPVEFNVFRVVATTTNGNMTLVYDPLNTVGINFHTLGFGSCYLLLSTWLAALCYAYLPPDGARFLGTWCYRNHASDPHEVTDSDLSDPAHPTYILEEKDVDRLRRWRTKAERAVAARCAGDDVARGATEQTRSRFPSVAGLAAKLPMPNVAGFAAKLSKWNPAQQDNGTSPAASPTLSRTKQQQQSSPDIEKAAPPLHVASAETLGTDDDDNVVIAPQIRALHTTIERSTSEHDISAPDIPPELLARRLGRILQSKLQQGGIPQKRESVPAIVEQVNANLYCLETEITMLHFSFLAYNFGAHTDEIPMTFEQKSAQIEDKSYRLIEHVENADTDIQVAVFCKDSDSIREARRVIVAFRGTSTSKNVWQDIDYLFTDDPLAATVEPITYPITDWVSRTQSVRKPQVHRGFYKAYLSIRDDVMRILEKVLVQEARQGIKTVVFVCGHSLGGALGSHCAFELAVRWPVGGQYVDGLQLSTFGSPRVGNFSYVSRFARIVPTTHRHCHVGDPVPRLPPAHPFADFHKSGFLHLGVEILCDSSKGNMLLGPLFIERQIQHVWGNTSGSNHVMGAYFLTFMFWIARVHGKVTQFDPKWWLCVVNHQLRTEMRRAQRICKSRPEWMASLTEQLDREGAVYWSADLTKSFTTTSVQCGPELSSSSSRKLLGYDLFVEELASCGLSMTASRDCAEKFWSRRIRSLANVSLMKVADMREFGVEEHDAMLLYEASSVSRCPHCAKTDVFDSSGVSLQGSIMQICPDCGEKIYLRIVVVT